MNELAFKKIIIIFAIIGLILLICFSFFSKPNVQQISNLSKLKDGSVVSVTGIIRNVNEENNYIKFNFCENTNCIQSILFNPSSNQSEYINYLSTSKKKVTISGQYKIYMGTPEIIIYNLGQI
jgi:uncharacterized radical SAM superfamily Fe-S cluster-containing enzyme